MASEFTIFFKISADFQKHKPREAKYGNVPPNISGVLARWETVNTNLIRPYKLTANQYQPDDTEK